MTEQEKLRVRWGATNDQCDQSNRDYNNLLARVQARVDQYCSEQGIESGPWFLEEEADRIGIDAVVGLIGDDMSRLQEVRSTNRKLYKEKTALAAQLIPRRGSKALSFARSYKGFMNPGFARKIRQFLEEEGVDYEFRKDEDAVRVFVHVADESDRAALSERLCSFLRDNDD
jgi:hypothetical protein